VLRLGDLSPLALTPIRQSGYWRVKMAWPRPTKFYRDVHSRAVRGEISEQELAAARATIEELSR